METGLTFNLPSSRRWSVVIPVCGRTQFVRRAVESVNKALRAPDDQIIVCAFGNLDVSAALDGAAAPRGFDLKRYTDSLGSAADWNRALTHASGEWIHLLHDDDYVREGFYDVVDEVPPQCDAYFTGYQNFIDTGEVIYEQNYGGLHGELDAKKLLSAFQHGNLLNPPAVAVRRTSYQRWGGYRTDLGYHDWEFYARIARYGLWWCNPRILACYRHHPDSTLLTHFDQYVQQARAAIAAYADSDAETSSGKAATTGMTWADLAKGKR